MTTSASGQGEANSEFWLATWAGEMGSSCPLEISRVRKKKRSFGHVVDPLSTSIVFFCCCVCVCVCFYGPSIRLGPLKYKNKDLANTPPSWPHAWARTHIYQTVHRYTEPQASIPSTPSHTLGRGVERPFEGGFYCIVHRLTELYTAWLKSQLYEAVHKATCYHRQKFWKAS